MNNTSSMKSHPSATKSPLSRFSLSRLCRILLGVAVVKLCLLGSLILNVEIVPQDKSLPSEPSPEISASATNQAEILASVPHASGTLVAEGPQDTPAQGPAQKKADATTATQSGGTSSSSIKEANTSSVTSLPAPRREGSYRIGISAAMAADAVPPAPKVRPMQSPTAPESVFRPDEATPAAPPAPSVNQPFQPKDTAQRRQEELNRREQELLNLQQQMEARVKELNNLEQRMQGMLQDAGTQEDEKMTRLIDMYANMKPKQAAQVLTTLDERVAVKILSGLKGRQAGEIFSYMDPGRAAVLSELLSKMQIM